MLKRILFTAALVAGLAGGTAQAQPTPFVGEVMIFSGNFCPNGWVPMKGQLLPISEFVLLYNIVGTTYGGNLLACRAALEGNVAPLLAVEAALIGLVEG